MDLAATVANIFDGDCTVAIGGGKKTGEQERQFVLSEFIAEIGLWLDEKLNDHPFDPHPSNAGPVEGRLGPQRTVFDVTEEGFDTNLLISKDKLTLQSQNAFSTVKANCCVYSGRWMYEVQLRSKGVMQIGWCSAHCKFTQDTGVGDTRYSYGLDGSKQRIWHVYTQKYGPFWRSGDIFGVCVDMDAGRIEYYRNGAPLGEAFKDIERGPGLALYPAVSLAFNDSLTANFGGSPFKHPVERYKPLQEAPAVALYQADCLLKYLVNLSGAISQHARVSNGSQKTSHSGLVTPESMYMLLAACLIERIAPLLGNSYVVEDKVFSYIRGMCVLRSNSHGSKNEAPTQPGAPESTLGTFLTLLWTYLELEEMKLFLKKLLNYLANTYKETPVDLEYEKQRKIIVILTCVCNHPATRKYLLEYKFFKKNCLPLFLYTKPPDESTLEQLLPDDHIWTEGLGGSRETYLAACERLKAHTSVLYTLQKNLIHILMNNHDGNEANSPSSRRIFVAKVRKFVMENNVELRGLYSSTTQPAIGLSFLCTLLDVAKTLWEEECDHERGLDGKTVPPTIDCRFFYDGTFKYSNLDRIGGVLSYLRKHFRTQLIERLGADHPSLASVDQPSDLRSEIAAFNVFLDSAMFLVSGGPSTAYSLVSRAANSIPDRHQQSSQQHHLMPGMDEGHSTTATGQPGQPSPKCTAGAIGCGQLDPYRAVCELLDCCVIFYNAVAHKYVVMIADLRDNITHLSDILLETKSNCDEVMHNLEALKRCSIGGSSGTSLQGQKSHEELLNELEARFGQRKSIFAKRSMELARKQAWYRSVALGTHRRGLLCWLLGIIFETLHTFSAEEILFAFLPETYINVTPILLDTVLDFSFHDTAIQHELAGDAELILSSANFLAKHLADPRVILASCKDALIQALGSLTCHEAGIRALESASAENQLALVRALLRPYENRAWGQSNWLLLRFWLGDGFAYRESRPPCVWQAGKDPSATQRSLGLYRSRAKNGSHTGLLHLIAPACPSKHFQRLISETLSNDEPYCTTFLNSVLSQLNWAFSEFIHILQDIQNISQRDEQLVIETKQLKICSMCFELTVSLMRALEMIVTITPSLLQDAARANSEIILSRICQLAIQVLSRVTVPPGCFQHVMDLCLPDLSNVTHFAIISAAIGMLLALMRHELGSSTECITKIPRISKYLLTDTSFHIASLEYALGEVKTPITNSDGEAPRGNFDPKMRAHIDPLTNEVRVPSPFRKAGGGGSVGMKEIIPDPPIIKFNMADYPNHVLPHEVGQIERLIETLQLRQTLLSEITILSEDSLCPICYAKSNSAAFDPCQHQSCETCIMQHLMNSKQCFYCKILIIRVTRQDGAIIYEACNTPPAPPALVLPRMQVSPMVFTSSTPTTSTMDAEERSSETSTPPPEVATSLSTIDDFDGTAASPPGGNT
ncbi:E3 ubiquitin-protein ligase RNF123 isoform X1 [Anopheles arabiensis]|uniref:RING-type E3 ubiquitin transferase n=1 Tax=Anopheles arabiensis TaxID=7173 RepID=A0A182HGE4_ANOAR|nr:E3 ubiquitin-protein ligase RNF123 isoform X1 [Anopheles arabiensis]